LSRLTNIVEVNLRADKSLFSPLSESPERNAEIISERISENVKDNQTNDLYEFGRFRLDAKKRRLWKDGELVALTPKEFEVLFVLIRRAGIIVEKDELLDTIWKDIYVEEATLTRNISFLRKKLGTDGADKFIETLPKRGYRFLPAVRKVEDTSKVLIIEEQTLTKITVEEIVSLPDELQTQNPPFKVPSQLTENPKSKIQNPKLGSLAASLGILAVAAIGFIVYQNYFKKSAPTVINVSRVVPFSGLPGRENMPTFSPDGKQIAFVWNGGNELDNFDVYLKLVGAGEPVRLTKNAADDLFPTFAPDGKSIAFVRSYPTRSEVFIIPALGGAERKIADLRSIRSNISCAPDGKNIAVSDSDTNSTASKIYLVNIENGAKTPLTTPPDATSDNTPAFAPDGKTICFLRSFGTVWQEIFTSKADGSGEAKQITFDKTRIRGAAFGADGKIVFASQRGNNQWNLWQISATGGEPQMIATNGKNLANPAIAPDGKSIAFAEESNDTNIWQFTRDEGGVMRDEKTISEKNTIESGLIHPSSFIPHPLIRSSRADHSPNYAPDGKRIAFVSDRSGVYQVWTADADGANQLQLTDTANSAGSPRFSPDGKSIVFDAQIEGSGDIFVINANGGESRNLTNSPVRDVLPSWGADGKSVIFTSNRSGDYQLWKIPSEGGEAIQLTKTGAFESFASPDGNDVFYTKERGVAGLWRVSVNGGDESAVPELIDAGYWRYWSVTPHGIFFVAHSVNAPYTIRFYDFVSKQIKDAATTDKTPIWVFSGFSATPDGKSLLFAQNDQNASSIMIAEIKK
jgi:Tol biopolymer transport system component